jgi:class 3 adenylate cyclase/tetratricopeptide (TPR) repeat protein
MQCPRCDVENREDRKFCSACGQELPVPCPRCAFANDPRDRYCGGCGHALEASPVAADLGRSAPRSYTPRHLAEKILTSRSALEGERKQVTVLFADVSGFTALSERLDPEEMHALMRRVFDVMLAEVHRYEGTVNQFLGDGIMALFGAPIAHEDHGQRAVHAALGIREALERDETPRARGIRFQVRQGLNTGLVVVGSIGSDLRMDYTAVGDTTNVAARLQQTADPGRIAISDAVYRLVSGYFHTRSLGELPLKGKAEPVRVWEVISARGARSRLEVEAERGLTRFVGREPETRLLAECFQKARAGRGQVVFLVGEPGIGKSRLLVEFHRSLGTEATWVEGRSMSFGRSIAFHPLIDLLRRTFRIEETDSADAIATKIDRSVLRLGEDLRPTLPYLRYLLAVDPGDPAVPSMDPNLRRAEVFSAVRRLLHRAAEVRPQVVVFEDVHWMDQATEGHLARLADSIAASRILMILTYRPGYAPPFGDRTYHTRVALTSLPIEASVEMTRAMLAAESVPDEVQALIARKAEGNPFFVEEVVRSLVELGAIHRAGDRYLLTGSPDQIQVPDTIQDVIMARIDRLAEEPRRTLQLASVIGREFTGRLIERIADVQSGTEGLLQELKAIELIHEKTFFPELAYMFKHALTHEVAYGSLLVHRRKELHRLVGLAIEELYADRLAEHYEVLAHHFTRAEDWSKAFDYLVRAAEKASRAPAFREALAFYATALDVAGRLGEEVPPTRLVAIHRATSQLHLAVAEWDESRRQAERALQLARSLGDRPTAGWALAQMGLATFWGEDFERAVSYAEQAIATGEEGDAAAAVGFGLEVLGSISAVTGRLEQAEQQFARSLTIGRSTGEVARQSFVRYFQANIRNWQGAYRESHDLATDGARMAKEHGLVIPLLRNQWTQAVALAGVGDYDRACALLEDALALAEKIGDEAFIPRYLNTLGWLRLECHDLDRALELNRLSVERARRRRHATGVEQTVFSEINRADAFLARGDAESAQELLTEAHRLVKDNAVYDWMRWRSAIHCFVSEGELWLARDDPARAVTFADHSLESATQTGSRKYMVRAWRLKGDAARLRQDWDAADRALREALALAEPLGNPRELWQTHAAIGRLHDERRDSDAARRAYQSARAGVEGVVTRLQHPELRAGLLQDPVVQQIYDRSG